MPLQLTIAIAGLGAIGAGMAREIVRSEPMIRITAVAARDETRAKVLLAQIGLDAPVLSLEALPGAADLVVECLPAKEFDRIADATLAAGRGLMVLSAGQLARRTDLIPAFRERGQRLIVPTGAILGLDVTRALSRGEVHSCRIVTRKSPGSLAGAPFAVANGIDLGVLKEPTLIFSGTATEAARGFPANVNVAVALALAGVGPERTRCDIWVDPSERDNIHIIEIETPSTSVSMTIRGRPDPSNPRTSQMTPLSAVDALRRLVDPVWIGS
ncbi:MAG: aspartate dehydrogenase [Beijerinckiaceae bacterium]